MQLQLGQHILSSDGHDLGAIKHLILDPATGRLKTFVVEKGWFLPGDTEIPLETIQEKGGERLYIGYTAEEVKNLPRFDESRYTAAPPEQAGAFPAYPPQGLLWPNGFALPPLTTAGYPLLAPGIDGELGTPPPPEVQEILRRQDENNAVISAGDEVISADGEKVGEVRSVAFDSATGKPTGLVVRQGWLFTKDWTLPAAVIGSVEDGVVYLKQDKAQLQDRREDEQYATEWSQNNHPAPQR